MPLSRRATRPEPRLGPDVEFWAKTTEAKAPGISVLQHCRVVGAIAGLLARQRGSCDWTKHSGILAALHDSGKISLGFQAKCEKWLQKNDLPLTAGLGLEADHAKLSQWALQEWLGGDSSPLRYWAVAVGAHHGRVKGAYLAALADGGRVFTEARDRLREVLVSEFGTLPTTPPELEELGVPDAGLWALTGLITLADWIGSDEQQFPNGEVLPPARIAERARQAVTSLGLTRERRPPSMGFADLFGFDGFEANDLQSAVLKQGVRPGSLVIVEGAMGCGKTEAALGLVHQMLHSGDALGFYFALPTQVTSNRIHSRVADFVARMGLADAVRLMHANAWLQEPRPGLGNVQTWEEDENSKVAGRDWFCSSKRAILSPFGVGTVDQALLGVVAVKHFFLRQYGLANKVVILDEVHSYDLYTGTLIDILVKTLRRLGATVVLLSATLSRQRRQVLLGRNSDELRDAYPLVTIDRPNGDLTQIPAAEHRGPTIVAVDTIPRVEALAKALTTAEDGACVLWICNTVSEAQSVYCDICSERREGGPRIGLLHSRFPFFRRETLEDEWMSALGKDGARPAKGCILVSTQVVEQSVDIDADLLITEVAPTDMLLQRIGRLWRHDNQRPPCCSGAEVFLIQPDNPDALAALDGQHIKECFGKSARVYAPYVLLRTWELWRRLSTLDLPRDIRRLITQTYTEIDDEPDVWREMRRTMENRASRLEQLALAGTQIMSIPALHDEEGVATRYAEVPTIAMLPVRHVDSTDCRKLTLLDGQTIHVPEFGFDFSIAKAVHRNLVRLPRWAVEVAGSPNSLAPYLREPAIACLLLDTGSFVVLPHNHPTRLIYTESAGVGIGERSPTEYYSPDMEEEDEYLY